MAKKLSKLQAIKVAATGAPLPGNMMVNGVDVTPPPFLIATGPRLTNDEAKDLALQTSGAVRTWAPFRDYDNRPDTPPPAVFVDDRAAPVQVNLRSKDGAPTALASYANMDEFDKGHDHDQYPISRTVSIDAKTATEMYGEARPAMTIVMVRATPWAGRPKVEGGPKRVKGELGGKAKLIADLLMRSEGCTTKDVLAATGWPAVSMPAQAKVAGLTLRKEKVDGVTRYWGAKDGEPVQAAPVANVEPAKATSAPKPAKRKAVAKARAKKRGRK